MQFQFEIEGILILKDRQQAYVQARQLTEGDWLLSKEPRLGGVPIRQWVDVPRVLDESGHQRKDIFAFCLVNLDEAELFHAGKEVELLP